MAPSPSASECSQVRRPPLDLRLRRRLSRPPLITRRHAAPAGPAARLPPGTPGATLPPPMTSRSSGWRRGIVDVAGLARQAVAGGADLLGVAGGDGTQALVAGIRRRARPAVPGDQRRDPQPLRPGPGPGPGGPGRLPGCPHRRGRAAGGPGRHRRPHVREHASFGAYAEVVQSPAYRDDKRGTTLQMLPDLLKGYQGARLTAHAGHASIEGPQALLVSNDPYGTGDVAGLGRRARLDAGTLGVVAIRVDSARQAIELVRRGHGQGADRAHRRAGHRRRRPRSRQPSTAQGQPAAALQRPPGSTSS